MVALLWLSSWCLVTVSVLWPIIHGAVGWYAMWDCGISWLNSFTFFNPTGCGVIWYKYHCLISWS